MKINKQEARTLGAVHTHTHTHTGSFSGYLEYKKIDNISTSRLCLFCDIAK